MKDALKWILLAGVALLIDLKLSVFGQRTDFLGLLVYWFALDRGPVKGVFFGGAAGLVEDGLVWVVTGPALLGRASIGYLSSFISHGFFRWTPLLGFLAAFVITCAGGLVELAAIQFLGEPAGGLSGVRQLFLQGIINGAIGSFLRPAYDDYRQA
jgi:hypothetical protein